MYSKLIALFAKPLTLPILVALLIACATALYFYVSYNNNKIDTLDSTIVTLNQTIRDKDLTIKFQEQSFKISEKTLIDYIDSKITQLAEQQNRQSKAIDTYVKNSINKPVEEYEKEFSENDLISISGLIDRMYDIYREADSSRDTRKTH